MADRLDDPIKSIFCAVRPGGADIASHAAVKRQFGIWSSCGSGLAANDVEQGLTLAELDASAGTPEAWLLPFFHSRVTGKVPAISKRFMK